MPVLTGEVAKLRQALTVDIELCGVPGVGKTTFLRLLLNNQHFGGRWVWRYADLVSLVKMLPFSIFWLVHPSFLFFVFLLTVSSFRSRTVFKRGLVVLKEVLKRDLRRRDVTAVDQGVLQALSSFLVLFPLLSDFWVRMLVDMVYGKKWPAILILVYGDVSEVYNSLMKRLLSDSHNATSLDSLEEDDALRYLRIQEDLLNRMALYLKGKTPVCFVSRDDCVFCVGEVSTCLNSGSGVGA